MSASLKIVAFALITSASAVQWVPPTETTPAYYAVAPKHGYPPLLAQDQRTGAFFTHAYQVLAYDMADKVEPVLFQQPCSCRCDRALRHKSLHSCFEGTHGAVCATCMRQAIYTYQQTKLGKSPAEIRAGIAHGEWQNVDVANATL